ncbi:hypothetical protein DL546_002837 [Coniochaeta pulveracea]|uniref:DNA polymerase lambda n=1 Tax=Coniochaeta pulveracea TaxID=177199 RepID=A0A420XXK9_9PEZI|nr:hypothetical protein DL546_002837 [Coniochaeta pulveracea]
MSWPSLKEKSVFFEQLDALEQEDEDEDYTVNAAEMDYRKATRSFFGDRRSTSSRKRQPDRFGPAGSTCMFPDSQVVADTPARSAPASRPPQGKSASRLPEQTPRSRTIEVTPLLRRATTSAQALATGIADTTVVTETPVVDTPYRQATLQRSATLPSIQSAHPIPVEQSPSISSDMRKRKRNTGPLNMVPEAEQIFRGLTFYYVPDNDIAPLRKLRITRAREHGASWVRILSGATHVIVDKNLSYKDIEAVVSKAGASGPIIVNEDYPVECIQFRNILNPDQHRYRVAGCPLVGQSSAPSASEPQQPTQVSDHSLKVIDRPPNFQRLDSTASGGSTSRGEESAQHNGSAGHPILHIASEMNEEPEPMDGDIPKNMPDLEKQPPSNPLTQPLGRQDSERDELSDYISLIQQYKDLPLDDEDEDMQSVKSHSPVSDVESGSDASSDTPQPAKKKRTPQKAGQKAITYEDRFACHTGGTKDATASSTNPNARTIEILQSMSDYYGRTNDHWRTTAYRKAITTLKRHPTRITTAKEAYLLPNVGPRLAAKIEEIVTTNKLQRLNEANSDPTSPILELFLKIYGVGISQASKWISQGYRTLDDLLAHVNLSTNQRIGIGHFEDLNTRIPRAEVGALAAYVRRTAQQVDPAVELLVGGSYRRGADSSGDIDFIVTKKGTTSETDLVPFLDEIVTRLTEAGFLVAALAAHKQGKGGEVLGGSKWHGCCVLPVEEGRAALGDDFKPRWRRIDFLLVPESQYGAALIYFTGNDIFNRSIRLLASKKGMRLNQRGLFKDVMRGPNRVKVTEGELVEGRDEKKIFEILGVKWREPKDRWC